MLAGDQYQIKRGLGLAPAKSVGGEGHLVDLLHTRALVDGVLLQRWQLIVLGCQLILVDRQTQLHLQASSGGGSQN